MKEYDVIVIGSGGGTKIALPCARQGMRVALIEEDDFGGTCLNRGCIPSKMLIHPAEVADQARHSQAIGLDIAGEVQLRFHDVIARIKRDVTQTSLANRDKHKTFPGITFYAEHARFTRNHVLQVGEDTITAPKIFVATGSRPQIPDLPGLAETPFITSKEALQLPDAPKRMLVIGAGYIATELGGAYAIYGSDVHFLVRSRFLRGLDIDISDEFERVFRRNCHVHRTFAISRIKHDGQQFTIEGSRNGEPASTIEGDTLLVATGVTPNTDKLGLENTGIKRSEDGFIIVNAHLETDVHGVYALGDCIGNYLFRHTVNYEGEYLMKTAFRTDAVPPIDYGPVPYAVFTVPQIAGVGLTEEQASILNLPVIIGKASYADSTPGMARASDHGFAKVIFDAGTRKVIGAHIIGEEAASMIHLFIAMIKKNGTLDDLMDMIFIHPALAEVARDAVRNAAAQT
ncbi:MAG: dihydrolipoyl dehydrogenase family protein [Kiritimatiellia bacterium]